MKKVAVIMAGGRGERFWPKSRASSPKQFISILSEKTMIQETVERLNGLIDIKDVFVVTGKEYFEITKEQLPMLPEENIIIEPMGKNTAACIGLAAMHIQNKYADAIMIVLPADHLIKNKSEFVMALENASEIALENKNIVTIGILPQRPDTGYGYIQVFDKIVVDSNYKKNKVVSFKEKPNRNLAKEYVMSGKYLWNSGMFIWKTSTILGNMKSNMPKLYKGLTKIGKDIKTNNYEQILLEEYGKFESISIDYGIMEKAEDVYVIPGMFGWDDVGSWSAMERIISSDDNDNIFIGNVVEYKTSDCIVQSSDKLLALVGVKDLIVVDAGDVVLICDKNNPQDIKKILEKIKNDGMEKYV